MIAVPGEFSRTQAFMAAHGFHVVPPFSSLEIMDGDKLAAVIVYNDYTGPNVEISAVSDGVSAFPRRIYRAIFDYPFNQLRVNRVTVRTAAGNKPVRKFIRRLGFKPEGKLRGFYENDDGMLYSMLRGECPWLTDRAHGGCY